MLDPRRLRTELDDLRAGLARKGADLAELDRAAAVEEQVRKLAARRDELRGQVNALSKQVAEAQRAGDGQRAEALKVESRALGEQEASLADEAGAAEHDLRELLLRIPNLPAADALDGAGEDDNQVIRQAGPSPESFGEHQRVPHWDIGTDLGLLDLERAAKISGSMFPMYRGPGAKLVRALTWWALERHRADFEEIRPPHLVRTDTLTATGQLPKFADDAYHLERDDLWAIPTAEVPLTSIGRDEVLDEADLPMRFAAYTPCYRREAGAAGRDTRGLLRSHEFDKVEVLAYCTPEQAPAVHAELLERAESMLRDLELSHRVVEICTGDLGQSHARQFDLEVYAPGCAIWLEVSSVSWFTDYQARRANIRYRPAGGRGTAFVHTLNGSALAWPRIWAAVVESNRRVDGSIALPGVLQPLFDGSDTLARPAP